MVCDKCELKLHPKSTPDPWKKGTGAIRPTKYHANKLLSYQNFRSSPYSKRSCKLCKCSVYQPGVKYCQGCASKKGICAMCGRQLYDTSSYRQSTV
ncbi:hypothetical protein GJ496_003164 [Pomphorhynchus laevis]|nr:hypothetical protein GJ496_003164 [Pomphorhynchus laevis]